MKKTALAAAIILCVWGHAQDTSKVIRQELGMNVTSLLQQIRIFTVTNSPQPYDLFYNIYYRNLVGIRAGIGVLSVENNTQIEGQNLPRTDENHHLNLRLGGSWYAMHSRWVDLNFFVDGLIVTDQTKSTNTSTVQVFPNPVTTRTVVSDDRSHGGGAQVGAGIRINLNRYLSVYFESSIIYLTTQHVIEDRINETGQKEVYDKSLTDSKGWSISLPATFYLMIRF